MNPDVTSIEPLALPTDGDLLEVPEDVYQKAKAEHGPDMIQILEAQRPKIEVLVRAPSQGAIDIYRKDSASITDPEKMAGAASGLFWSCVVWPAKPQLARLLRHTPMTADMLGIECLKFAGDRQTIRVKKR